MTFALRMKRLEAVLWKSKHAICVTRAHLGEEAQRAYMKPWAGKTNAELCVFSQSVCIRNYEGYVLHLVSVLCVLSLSWLKAVKKVALPPAPPPPEPNC